MNKIHIIKKKALFSVAVAASAMLFAASNVEAEHLQRPGWYATGSAMGIVDVNGSGPRIDLGNSVVEEGTSDYDGNMAASFALGHEFTIDREKCHPQNVRLEMELVHGSVHRNSIDVSGSHLVLNDNVKYQALFLNAMLGIVDTPHTRWWVGAGVGYGQTRFPDASYATTCGCLKPVTHDDVAFRVKLQAERDISKNAALFAEAGYMKFTNGKRDAIPAVNYGDLHFTNVSLGMRIYF